ncbi:MAG: efflux transporter outer membrane subunit [Planctomycetota bacterium]
MTSLNAWVALALSGALSGCWTSPEPAADRIDLSAPEAWTGQGTEETPGLAESGVRWWTTFDEPSLNSAVDDVLGGSFELGEAWARLAQARAGADSAGAPRFPTVDLDGSGQRFEIDQSGGGASGIPLRLGEAYSLGPSFSYEVDLFGRIDSALQSARLEEAATAADVQATALALSGRATDAWLTAVQNRELSALTRQQIETGRQLLSVTENRFGTGSGSVLDVLQQKRQLAGTEAELPRFLGETERALHLLNVLRGEAPRAISGRRDAGGFDARLLPNRLPPLPPLPDMDLPSTMLELRPDVVAAMRRVERADRDVAAALANRFPRLSLSGSFNYDGSEIEALFDRTITSLLASLTVPLIDGGSRRAEVRRQEAALQGAVAALQTTLLTAFQEVEDSLSRERRGVQRVNALEAQFVIAEDEVAQARRRYVGGVDTYLQVLSAIQNLQTLERQLITERADVLRSRATLLRALGGAWLDDLEPQD